MSREEWRQCISRYQDMAKKRREKKFFQPVTSSALETLQGLIPCREYESITACSDKLAIAVLRKFFGMDWIQKHITKSKNGYLRVDASTDDARERSRMRRIMLAEMLYNFQFIKGFDSCLIKLNKGEIEATYGALEIGRMLVTTAIDSNLKFRFVTECGIKRRDYDLSIKFSDGVSVRAETKCKMEETKITLRTIEESMSNAKGQLPLGAPGIIFIKIPRHWIDDEKFATGMRNLADRFLARSPSIVSVKYYAGKFGQQHDGQGQTVWEIVLFDEHQNPAHKFKKLKDRDWRMFPRKPSVGVPPTVNYNGLPSTWQRMFIQGR